MLQRTLDASPESQTLLPKLEGAVAPRILVVEDDQSISTLLQRVLRPLSATLVITASLRAAIDAARQASFDLAILDHYLPDGRSLGFGRALLARRETSVIFMSGMHEATPRVEALGMGAADWIGKPFFPEELLVRTRRALDRDEAGDAPAERRFRFSGWTFLSRQRELHTPDSKVLRISPALTRLLHLFLESDGEPVTQDMVALAIPDKPWQQGDPRVEQAVNTLRRIFTGHDSRPPRLQPRIVKSNRQEYRLNGTVIRVDRTPD